MTVPIIEMLHVGQFLRTPNISTSFPAGLVHEIAPSFIGTPVIYGSATTVLGGTLYNASRGN